MSHYKPYPIYKESGVEWLGDVPSGWEVRPLKYGSDFINGCAFKPEQWSDEGSPIIRIENLNGSVNFNKFAGDVDPRYHVLKGDLLFGWSGNRGTSFGPVVWPHDGKYFLNQHIFKVTGFSFQKSWFYWCLKALTAYVEKQAHGIIGMVHITKGDLGQIKIAQPSWEEQRFIAQHLDFETNRIDRLVSRKTRFIELLREKRQAMITHAVTKGLDPSVLMKNSGVEWLGIVPAHWSVTPLKYLAHFQSGGTPSKENPQFWDGGLPWASAKDMKTEQLSDTVDHISELALVSGGATLVPSGSILVVVRGMILARVFPVIETLVPMAINQDLKALNAGNMLDNRFLAYLLRGLAPESLRRLEEAGHGTKALRMESWTSMSLTVPPLVEQREILDFIYFRTTRIDKLIIATQNSIKLLNERRSALITAAVTGQIDLREAA